MKTLTFTKITSHIVIFVFLVSFLLPISAVNAVSQTSIGNDYANPNQTNSESSRYKFKMSDVVNSQMLTSVIGCTGVVNKTAKWMSGLIQSPEQKALQYAKKAKDVLEKLKKTCAATKTGLELAGQLIPTIGGTAKPIDTALSKIDGAVGAVTSVGNLAPMEPRGVAVTPLAGLQKPSASATAQKEKVCLDAVDSTSKETVDQLIKQNDAAQAKNFKEQCFDGIAITLAKNQLTAMARSTMNWVATGYGGNPLFVQNMRNLTYNLEKNVVETGIDVLLAPKNASPYAADFSRTRLNNVGVMASSTRFLGGLQSDLSNFVTDPRSYYSNEQLDGAQETQTSLQRAQNANMEFSRNFASGGWNAWLALTQREQNNPLGYNMVANQYLSDMQAQVVSDQKAEITQNNGFMSQKKCTSWYVIDPETDLWVYQTVNNANEGGGTHEEKKVTTNPTQKERADPQACANWKTITPGSLIKDKVSNYLDSPDRQAELVKTINDGLNLLFSSLLSKLQTGGLLGLSDSSVNTSNWTDNMNDLSNGDGSSSGSSYNNNGAYNNFNLTRDLGNTYIHENAISYGTWDAASNFTITTNPLNTNKKLYPSLNPEISQETETEEKDDNGKKIITKKIVPIITNNAYYTVIKAGKTKLINEGYNNWEVDDRAFWNGSEWQNWKKKQQSPIAKRGVIQIQQDYIVAATEAKDILKHIMPKLGELDYCIPGPNPSYETNSINAQSAYQDWVNSIYTGPLNQGDQDRMEWRIDRENSSSYKNLANIFGDNPKVWETLTNSNFVAWFLNYFGPFDGTKNEGTNHYAWKDRGIGKYKEAVILQQITTNYTNNSLFQIFYDTFTRMMNRVYFNTMSTKYLDSETSIGKNLNPSYIPMAQNGVDLVKDMAYYNDDYNKKINDYSVEIDQARTNIAKLQPIRDEVSGIIRDAQKRRNDNLIKILEAEAKRTGEKVLTEAEYKTKYAKCLTEEDIQVFDAEKILERGTKEAENCTDGIDNDLNGLTDKADPVCKNYYESLAPISSEHCEQGAYIVGAYGGDSNPCTSRTKETCSNTYYTNSFSSTFGSAYMCNWITNGTPAPTQSVSGCTIDPQKNIGKATRADNTNCLSRTTINECTSSSYYTNGYQYACKWSPKTVDQNN